MLSTPRPWHWNPRTNQQKPRVRNNVIGGSEVSAWGIVLPRGRPERGWVVGDVRVFITRWWYSITLSPSLPEHGENKRIHARWNQYRLFLPLQTPLSFLSRGRATQATGLQGLLTLMIYWFLVGWCFPPNPWVRLNWTSGSLKQDKTKQNWLVLLEL